MNTSIKFIYTHLYVCVCVYICMYAVVLVNGTLVAGLELGEVFFLAQ